jgi:energy-coupling factor transporter ATP-binding protein EcfA2
MIEPQRAPVRPRVVTPASGEVMPLDDEIASLVDRDVNGLVSVIGPDGSGKSTALRHLAAVLESAGGVTLLDEPGPETLRKIMDQGLVVYTCHAAHSLTHAVHYCLAPWGEDDLIEYLLAAHHDRCGAILDRLKAGNDVRLAGGNPELLRIVLDQWPKTNRSAACAHH